MLSWIAISVRPPFTVISLFKNLEIKRNFLREVLNIVSITLNVA